MYYSMSEWRLLGFKRSTAKGKKYSATLENKTTKKVRTVNFGDIRYEQFKDSTGLGLYTHLDHRDKERKKKYQNRHQVFIRKGYYSPGYFSMTRLWT